VSVFVVIHILFVYNLYACASAMFSLTFN